MRVTPSVLLAGEKFDRKHVRSTATYGFDHFNRLRSVSRDAAVTYENPDSGTVSLSAGNSAYLYSALDERVQKTALGTTTTFIPTGPGQILAENKGGTWTNYLWFNGELVGIQRAGTTYYSFNDHLGRPEQLRDSNQTVVWHSLSGAFSRRILQDNIGGLKFGFPGQYYDAESDLWQNGFRDYDARNGRYIETDPISLLAGLNLYAYVSVKPLSATDKSGLADSCYRPLYLLPKFNPGVLLFVGDTAGAAISGGMSRRIDEKNNTVVAHEQIFLDDGTNYGYGKVGKIRSESRQAYSQCKYLGPDDKVKSTANSLLESEKYKASNYDFLNNNCQDFVDEVRRRIQHP